MRKALLLTACSVMAAAMAQPAFAHSEPASTQASEEGTWQDEIIVTARRRDETAQDSPVAMTVLNDTLLERYAVRGVDSIASMTPGLITGEAAGAVGGSIALRGVGSGESQAFIDQAVSFNVDGVPISTGQIMRVAQMDLKQIEVLRGPQALFFGKNSPGGIVSLVTASPGDKLEAKVSGGYEFKAREWSLDGMVSTPMGDNAGLRLAGHYGNMNGYINVISPVNLIVPAQPAIKASNLSAFPKREEIFLRGTFAIEPAPGFKITLKGTFEDTRVKGSTSYFSDITYCPYGTPQEIYVVPSNCSNDGTIVAAQAPAGVLALNPLFKPDGHRDSKQTLLSNTIDLDLTDQLKLTSVTGYYKADEAISSNGGYGLAPSNEWTALYTNEQVTQELRLASKFEGPINFVLGGFYEDRKLFTQTYIAIPTSPTPPDSCPACFELPYESTNQKQLSSSVFGQLMFDVSDKVQISAGGRYTHETKKLLNYFITTESTFAVAPIIQGTPVDVTKLSTYTKPTRLSFDNFSPEVTLTYKPQDGMMVFASFKQGYKSGGLDGAYTAGAVLTRGVNVFKPEKATGGEIGLKSTLADRQLIFNLTGYWYDYSDLQVAVWDTAARAFGTGNAGKARVRGVELETRFRPHSMPGLDLHFSAAYNDARFREFLAQCYKSQTQALGCNTTPDPNTAGKYLTQNLAGVQMRKAPKFTATAGAYYEAPVGGGLKLGLSADMSYSSGYNYGTDYQPYTWQKAFAKLDATLRLFSEDNRWELAVIGRNLTNMRNLVNGIDRTGTGGASGTNGTNCTAIPATNGCIPFADVIGTPTQPRSVMVQASWRY